MIVSSHPLPDQDMQVAATDIPREDIEENTEGVYSDNLEESLKERESVVDGSNSSHSTCLSNTLNDDKKCSENDAHSNAHSSLSSSVSKISKKSATSDINSKVSNTSNNDPITKEPSAAAEHAVVAATGSSCVTNESHRGAAVRSVNDEVTLLSSREELADLLELNDRLRMEVLASRRQKKNRDYSQNDHSIDSGTTNTNRKQQGAESTVRLSWRRDQTRGCLRRERERLLAQRQELNKELTNMKRAKSYLGINKKIRKEIEKLTAEKRSLMLMIRQNEKMLLKNENMGSERMQRSLAEEMKANSVLAHRSLKKAQHDAFEAIKIHLDVQLRVQRLERELEEAEKQQAIPIEDEELLHLHEMHRQKTYTILTLKKKLRQMKSCSTTENRHRSAEEISVAKRKERECLTKRIQEMQAEIYSLSPKPVDEASADNSIISKTSSSCIGTAPLSPSSAAKGTSLKTDSKPLSYQENAQQKKGLSKPSNKPDEAPESPIETALNDLKRRLEQRRQSNDEASFFAKSAPNKSEAPSAETNISKEALSGDVSIKPLEVIDEPIFFQEEDDSKVGDETGKTAARAEIKKNAPKEEDTSSLPPWLSDGDDDKLLDQHERSMTLGEEKLREGSKDVVEGCVESPHCDETKQLGPADSQTELASFCSSDPKEESDAQADAKSEVCAEEESDAKSDVYAEEESDAKSEVYAEEESDAKSEVCAEEESDAKSEVSAEVDDAKPAWLDFD